MPLGQPYVQADSPRTIPLAMPWWYRADQVTLVGSKASVLKDLSGNGADSLQGTDAKRWTWSATSGPNGTPGLTGAGTQWSQTAGNVNLSAVTQLTVIIVMTPAGLDSVGTDTLIANGDGVTTLGFAANSASVVTDGYEILSASPPANPPLSQTLSVNPAPANSPAIIEFTIDQTAATNQTNVWINGVLNAQTRAINNKSAGGLQSLVLSVGQNVNIPTQCLKGVLSECFGMIGLLTAQQRQNLYRGYLGPRYGISVP